MWDLSFSDWLALWDTKACCFLKGTGFKLGDIFVGVLGEPRVSYAIVSML